MLTDYELRLINARNLGKLERDFGQAIMTIDVYQALNDNSTLDREELRDMYRAYRNGFNEPVKVIADA